MDSVGYRRFNRRLLGLVAFSLAIVAALNFFVDPYGVWLAPRVTRLNAEKPLMDQKDRMRVAWEIRHRRPRALIFGTSTSKQLLPMEFEALVGEPACNAGLVMVSLAEIRAYLDLALRAQPEVSHVLLSLDFFQFNDLGYVATLKDAPYTTLPVLTRESLSLLVSSAGTTATASTLLENIDVSSPASPEVDRVAIFFGNQKMDMQQGGIYLPYRLSNRAFEDLRAIVATCRSAGVDLQVVISPMHAKHLDGLYSAGLGDTYENWIRQVAAITPLWDFSGYNHVTTEPVIDAMKLYTDPLHYSTDTGSLIVRRVYEGSSTATDFGEFVTDMTVDRHIADMVRRRANRGRL